MHYSTTQTSILTKLSGLISFLWALGNSHYSVNVAGLGQENSFSHKINTIALRLQNCDKAYCIQQAGMKFRSISENLIIINRTSIQSKPVHLATINTRSICNKINQFQHYILENSIDVCAVMETWLREDDEYGLHEIPPQGFKIISKPRRDGRQGGGIALIYKENYTINDHKINTNSQYMEQSAFDLHIQDRVIDLLVIYRYPNTSVVSFCNDLADILGNNYTYTKRSLHTKR